MNPWTVATWFAVGVCCVACVCAAVGLVVYTVRSITGRGQVTVPRDARSLDRR